MVTFQTESVHQIGEEIREIGRENWDAVKYPPLDEFEFANNDDAYRLMEDENILRVITARVDGELAGYVIIVVSPLQHHANNLAGNEIGFFVKPEYRNGRIGIGLINKAYELCEEAGVDALTFSVTPTIDYSPLLERAGFVETERVYMKRIK